MFEFRIASLEEAAELVKAEWPTAVISTTRSPLDVPLQLQRLRLEFDDYEMAVPGAPTFNDVLQIYAFAETLPADCKLLAHCNAGISRSSATAMIVLVARGLPLREALHLVRLQRPIAMPNRLMLRYLQNITTTPIPA